MTQAENKSLFDELVDICVQENGSDLHVSEDRTPIIRVDGFLIPLVKKQKLTRENIEGFLSLILSEGNLEEFKARKEVDFGYTHDKKARFRGNAYFELGKISIALRLIPQKIRTLAELNLPPSLEQFAHKQQGFFLVVGPAGHGKTTTLAALIDIINHERLEHVITIESPIEYIFTEDKSLVDQREVKIDTPSFHDALRGIFRQDIDILMIGEMRDTETISTAVTAAETGHYVMTTLHTNTASQTIERIIDSFPSNQQNQIRVQLAGSLAGIFSQRLIPRISGGLIPAYELLVNNAAVANLIRDNRTHEIDNVIETSSELGMVDLNKSLADLVRRGEITAENAFMYSTDPRSLEKIM
ncbi:MAG TPA: PilT/PilU family type 4a pilus ATPase [Candidatus Paceibacterota bacterium]